jgi:hypothetical protein
MGVTKLVQEALRENSEIRLVYEIAARAREAESTKQLPLSIGTTSQIGAVPTNSQGLVPPMMSA